MLHPIVRATPGSRLAAVEDLSAPLPEGYPREVERWAFWLGLPALCACVFIGLAIGTPFAWLFGGAVLIGPFGVVAAIIYLAMTSDTNGRKGRMAVRVLQSAPISSASIAARI